MKKKLVEWLRTQDKEFVNFVVNDDMLGNGQFSVEDLIALDLKYNPEDLKDDRSDE